MSDASQFDRIPGKWVLAGEHSVLRGGFAIAIPHAEFSLTLKSEAASAFRVSPVQARPIVEGLWARARAQLELPQELPRRSYRIESSIPIGSGLGSSAALCVAFVREWSRGSTRENLDLFSLARELENEFHGQSSGMDVATVMAGGPIRFSRVAGPTPLPVSHLPKFKFHDTGLRASTKECIERVATLATSDPDRARWIDLRMQGAAEDVERYLIRYDEIIRSNGSFEDRASVVTRLAKPMTNAQQCMKDWDLVPDEALAMERDLLAEGALAVKLTGAGLGGFLVSLWPESESP